MSRNARDFLSTVSRDEEVVAAFAQALVGVSLPGGAAMTKGQMLAGLIGNIVACVKANAAPHEWPEMAQIIAAEIRGQLVERA